MTAKKTPDGEGSVYQRASDGLWVAAVTVNGRRKVRYAKTEKAALKKRRDLLTEIEAGRPLPAGRTPTVGQYLRRWLDNRLPSEVEAGHLRQSTADSYRQALDVHVLSTDLASVKLPGTTDDIRAWQRAKLREKSARGTTLSPRTVGYAHAVLRRALNDAIRDNVLARNVAALVPLPVNSAKPVEAVTEESMAAVMAAAIEDPLRVLWLVMLGIGLRKGEALAMRWSRVDLDTGTVRIAKQIYRDRGQANPATGRRSGRLVEVDTKTAESKATILMPPALVAELRIHRSEQRRHRLAALVWVDPDLVFTSSAGTAIDPRNVNRAWAAVCRRAGVKLRVHDLRHAAATLAFAEGSSVKEIQGLLRHSRESTTSGIYVHLLEQTRRATADRMDGVLRRLAGA